ncbi:MAG: hypothetical protein RIR62_2192 [Pseudomonadota bacterium]|jgi:hypothetical protein
MRPAPAFPLALLLAACAPATDHAVGALPMDATGLTRQLAEVKDGLDAADRLDAAPTANPSANPSANISASQPAADAGVMPVKGLGFAQIAGQPGKTLNERRLMAIRAARMDALRDLTEQIHGIRLSATTSVRDAVVTDDRLAAVVEGTLRGARTVRITPKGTDSYEIEMAIDRDTVAYILRALRGQA